MIERGEIDRLCEKYKKEVENLEALGEIESRFLEGKRQGCIDSLRSVAGDLALALAENPEEHIPA